jgi:FlaA1/EpsC-like NDP-sugar epimerase
MNNSSKILKAGLIVGTLDILAACLQFYIKTGKNPDTVLKYVASGVFGKEAFTGGAMMSIYGLIFHYIIAFGFTIFFFWIYSTLINFFKNKILIAVLYGIFMWLVTTYIVIPLSKIHSQPFKLTNALMAITILIVCIGVPLSFIAGKTLKNNFGNRHGR